jgi:hypothetical protein
MSSDTRVYSSVSRDFLKDSDIVQSRIEACTVRNLPDPKLPLDAVNLRYLQNFTAVSTTPYLIISVAGTDWITIDEQLLFGNRQITINNTIDGAPNAAWRISKASANNDGVIDTFNFSVANDTNCRFEIQWLNQTPMQIRKTDPSYDGDYELTIAR